VKHFNKGQIMQCIFTNATAMYSQLSKISSDIFLSLHRTF